MGAFQITHQRAKTVPSSEASRAGPYWKQDTGLDGPCVLFNMPISMNGSALDGKSRFAWLA